MNLLSAAELSEYRLTLDEIAHLETVPEKWTDKRSPRKDGEIYICHDYLRIYDRLFTPMRDDPIRMLEIGLNVGASVKLWLQYFSLAHIHGMDIAPFQDKVGLPESAMERFHFHHGSAFDPYFLQRFVEQSKPFDIIIDDGAHFSGPIIMAFQYLWALVSPGGYYIIEDITEVKNPESHSPGYPDQLQFSENLLGQIIMGNRQDIDEAYASKDLVILKKR